MTLTRRPRSGALTAVAGLTLGLAVVGGLHAGISQAPDTSAHLGSARLGVAPVSSTPTSGWSAVPLPGTKTSARLGTLTRSGTSDSARWSVPDISVAPSARLG